MTDPTLLIELNRDVWEPFRAAYRAYDAESYLALHTPDLIRVGGPHRRQRHHRRDDLVRRPAAARARLTGAGHGTVPLPGGGGTVPTSRDGSVPTPEGVGTDCPSALADQTGRTFSACGPFWPWVVSNSTRWFSSRLR